MKPFCDSVPLRQHQRGEPLGGDDRGEFMGKLRDITKRCMIFETPVNHPQMKRSLDHIKSTLNVYFNHIKVAYVYNAYSSGYRAIFICLK